MKILVLGGDNSPEREVSLRSSLAIADALKSAGYEVLFYDPSEGDNKLRDVVSKADIVFPILHGVNGEDGVIQKKLELMGANFLGASSEVSAVTFNKLATHHELEKHGIVMPRFSEVTLESLQIEPLFKSGFVLKPIEGGSSVDTIVARSFETADWTAVKRLLNKYPSMIVEKLIVGQEVTVPILDNAPLPIIAIIPPENAEFDYENKYNGKTREICPVSNKLIKEELQKKAQDIAMDVHSIMHVRHLSRTDLIIRPNGDIVVLEINTMPGMTQQSLYPKSALVAGLSMENLVRKFVDLVGR